MYAKTTTAVALTGTAFLLPGQALAADAATDPPSPTQTALRPPVGAHLSVGAQMRAERVVRQRMRLSATAARLARRLADERDDAFRPARFRARLRGDDPRELRARVRELRRDLRVAARPEPAAPAAAAAAPHLQAIAACESGGNPATDTGNGFYGKYQFTQSTWASVGGSGNPAAAAEAEQDQRAAMLYAREGASPWPVCGR
jgi:hypothetical protein